MNTTEKLFFCCKTLHVFEPERRTETRNLWYKFRIHIYFKNIENICYAIRLEVVFVLFDESEGSNRARRIINVSKNTMFLTKHNTDIKLLTELSKDKKRVVPVPNY